MKDIETKADVKLLVESFYTEIMQDAQIGFIFQEHMKNKLEDHLPRICLFWESILFKNVAYKGNPMLVHLELNKKVPLTEEFFNIWINAWVRNVRELYEGENAEILISRAKTIKELMLYKISKS